MDSGSFPDQEFGSAFQPPNLNLVGSKGRDAHLADPDRFVRHSVDFVELGWPLMDLPQVPVEREAMHGYDVDMIENPAVLEITDESGVDRRHASEYARQLGVLRPDRLPGEDCHFGETAPARIDFGVPVGLVVGLVPDHCGFDHDSTPLVG
jgi:hypothetical protein